MQWLAADDDNGNLNDGTPHMTAIFAAFNRHGIACATPAPVRTAAAPADRPAAPTLTATAGRLPGRALLDAGPGATGYWVFRTEGHAGCNFGKTQIAEIDRHAPSPTPRSPTAATYYYNVVAARRLAGLLRPGEQLRDGDAGAGPPTPDFTRLVQPVEPPSPQGGSGAAPAP